MILKYNDYLFNLNRNIVRFIWRSEVVAIRKIGSVIFWSNFAYNINGIPSIFQVGIQFQGMVRSFSKKV